MDDLNLVELVRQSREGNSEALEKLINFCQPSAFRLALSILDDPDEANDAAQDALLHAMRAIHSYRAEATFQTWLYRIVINSCLGRLRKRQANLRLHNLLADLFRVVRRDDRQIETQTIQDENQDRIIQIINNLETGYRLPILLRYYHDLPIDQIAQVLDVSQRTVHTRLHQAYQLIRKALGEFDATD